MRRNKYGVSPAHERTVDGHLFASKREAKRYLELIFMQKCGDIYALELQPRFKFPMGFEYRADFRYCEWLVKGKESRQIVEDVKGMETAVFKLKHKCLKHFYPDVNLVIVK